ncbi:MAG: hypothetical protein ACUVTD_06970 [Nitrososphaerales archaeon]
MTWLREISINEKIRNRVRNCHKNSQKAIGHKISNSLVFVVRCFGSEGIKEAFKIKKGERFYTSYVFRLKKSILIGVLAKELQSGKIDFIFVVQRNTKPQLLMRVENLEKEQYHDVILGFAKSFAYSHSLIDVRAIYPKHSERLLRVD